MRTVISLPFTGGVAVECFNETTGPFFEIARDDRETVIWIGNLRLDVFRRRSK